MRGLVVLCSLTVGVTGCAPQPVSPLASLPPDQLAETLAAQQRLKELEQGNARQADWQPQLDKYAQCNNAASKGVASQQGDPLSLAVAARALCASTELELEKALHTAYGSITTSDTVFEQARKTVLEHNAAVIVAARAARASAPPKQPQARDY
jgi:hypothetical protein